MLLTLIIILVLIGSAVVGSLYSNFLVFYQNFSETENYHKARYASIAAIERAELVIKQRKPGFESSGGWMLGEFLHTGYGGSDNLISDFSYLSNTESDKNKSTLFWKINSRTDRIPSAGHGNVEKLLATGSSVDYNMMDYENAEIFMLYYDNATGNPYKKAADGNITKSDLTEITVAIRLPPYIRSSLGDLKTNESLIPRGYTDDALVDWQIKGKFENHNFTLFATQNAAGSRPANNDSTIRESDLNNPNGISLTFGKDRRNPKNSNNDDITIVSQDDTTIKNLTGNNQRFKEIFRSYSNFSDIQLRLSLLNLVLGGGSPGKRYPFLEYYADFGDTVSDKYYTIQTEGNYGDYQIDTVIYKPTITESILKSFTTIL